MLRDLEVHLFLPFIHFVYRCFMSWLVIVLFKIGRTTCAECSSNLNRYSNLRSQTIALLFNLGDLL
jgi:hypothetical protein